jgi:hypothetical protein
MLNTKEVLAQIARDINSVIDANTSYSTIPTHDANTILNDLVRVATLSFHW